MNNQEKLNEAFYPIGKTALIIIDPFNDFFSKGIKHHAGEGMSFVSL